MVHPCCDRLVLEIISYAWRISETYAAIENSMIQIDRLDLLITAVCASFAYFHVGPRTFSLEDPKFYY